MLITDEYIDYLRKTEPRVMSNKAGERVYHRKYLGIIQELNGHKYFCNGNDRKVRRIH